jgi:hypothetical protein
VKTILTSTDRPLVETVRATLEAEGIAVVVKGDAVTALPFIPMNVVVGDEDAAQAQDLVADLVSPPSAPPPDGRRRWGRIFLVAILLAVLIICGGILIG